MRMTHTEPELLERHGEPGLAIALVEGGEVVWAGGFGWADKERKKRVTAETIFPELAAAGCYTTAGDLARFVAAGVEGGARPLGWGVLRPGTVRQLCEPNEVNGDYGLGYELHRLPEGTLVTAHGGSNIGWKGPSSHRAGAWGLEPGSSAESPHGGDSKLEAGRWRLRAETRPSPPRRIPRRPASRRS